MALSDINVARSLFYDKKQLFRGWVIMRTKYGAKRVGAYDSKKEATRAYQLDMMQRGGLIRDLRHHVKLALETPDRAIQIKTPTGRVMQYEADFVYWDIAKNQEVIEDVKGMDTPASQIKRAALFALTGKKVVII